MLVKKKTFRKNHLSLGIVGMDLISGDFNRRGKRLLERLKIGSLLVVERALPINRALAFAFS